MAHIHPLLALIDTERPELSAVHNAIEQDNPSAALNELVIYFRNHVEPEAASLTTANEKYAPAAERITRREFTYYNEPGTVPAGDTDSTYKTGTD